MLSECKYTIVATNYCMIVLQTADKVPQIKPTPTVRQRQKQKRYSLTEFDNVIESSN